MAHIQVMKKAAGGLRIPSMSCKAFNGRIVTEYLADVSRLAARCTPATGAGRKFGVWLAEKVEKQLASFPSDPKIPLQAVGLKPRDNSRYFAISHIIKQSVSVCLAILQGRPWHDGLA